MFMHIHSKNASSPLTTVKVAVVYIYDKPHQNQWSRLFHKNIVTFVRLRLKNTFVFTQRLAVLVVALLSVHAAVPRKNFISRSFPDQAAVNHLGLDLCPTCVDFTDQTIDIILNIILSKAMISPKTNLKINY